MSKKPVDIVASLKGELDALWRFGLALTNKPDDALVLVQDTCVRALQQRHLFSAQSKLRVWLFQIQHRIWLNKARLHNTFTDGDGCHNATADSIETATSLVQAAVKIGTTDTAQSSIYLKHVYQAMEQLPEEQRLAVLLVNVEGFSYEEAALILTIPIGTLLSRLARARIAIGNMQLDKQTTTTVLSASSHSRVNDSLSSPLCP